MTKHERNYVMWHCILNLAISATTLIVVASILINRCC